MANCQEGVFILYASRRGYAFLDKRLYVLAEWFTADYGDRWKACGMPETLSFQTEPELGLDMVTALVEEACCSLVGSRVMPDMGKSQHFWMESRRSASGILQKWPRTLVSGGARRRSSRLGAVTMMGMLGKDSIPSLVTVLTAY